MKWFKHDADAFLSEGVDALIDVEGFAGYGRWNRILEIVAFKMDDTNRCHAEYSIQKWCRLLGLKQKKLISFLELTEKQLKTKVVYSENIIRIEIPNLLKKRDNYTKHLQVPKKQLVSKDIDKEVEVEKKKNIKKKGVYGEFENVSLSKEEYKKLSDKFSGTIQEKIEALSGYMKSKGKTYKDHYATILTWARKEDNDSPQQPEYKQL